MYGMSSSSGFSLINFFAFFLGRMQTANKYVEIVIIIPIIRVTTNVVAVSLTIGSKQIAMTIVMIKTPKIDETQPNSEV